MVRTMLARNGTTSFLCNERFIGLLIDISFTNASLREQVARNGRQRVLEEHNLVDKLRVMLEIAKV